MKALDKFTNRRYAALLESLGRYHQFQDADALHRIRVEVKKLKSVLQVMDASVKKFDGHQHYIPLRNIFRKAGQIRQPEVMLQLLMRHGLEGLPVTQLGDGPKHREEFLTEIPFYQDQITQHAQDILRVVRKVRTKDLSDYLRKRTKVVKSRLFPTFKPKELHNVRKSIKQLVYLSALVDLLGKRKLKFYSRLEQSIGELHDKEVLLAFLNALPDHASPAAVSPIGNACARDRRALAVMAKKFYQ